MEKQNFDSEKWRYYAAVFSIVGSVLGILWTIWNFYRVYVAKKKLKKMNRSYY
jgi:hypothetical protein